MFLFLVALTLFSMTSCSFITDLFGDDDQADTNDDINNDNNDNNNENNNDTGNNDSTGDDTGENNNNNNNPTTPENPTPDPVDPNAPTFAAGWVDSGYAISTNSAGEFVITKSATATSWTGAFLDMAGYTSDYSSFYIKFTTTNVRKFSIDLVVAGGPSDWASTVTVYSDNVQDGEHEAYVDFSLVEAITMNGWVSVSGEYIKNYQITGIKFSLDTSVEANELIQVEETCVINQLAFEKVVNTTPDDPNAPTLSVGYYDQGYNAMKNRGTDGYTITKYPTAGQWESATLAIANYSSAYSAFSLKFTSENVTNFSIQLYVDCGNPEWATNIQVYHEVITDGEHDVYVDFTYQAPISTSTWDVVSGYYVKDFQIIGIQIVLDTADASQLINETGTCVISEIKFHKVGGETTEDEMTEYVPSNTAVSFSDENADKVNTDATFDITQHTNIATANIQPYAMFSSGMCLQRDAINRIWGTSTDVNYIAAQIGGNVYYGTVDNGEWEIYLPKMNAGGPYKLTIISDAGRITLSDVYIGEVFFLGGQSNMEWQVGHSGEVLQELYSTQDCVNAQIRMVNMGWGYSSEPTLAAANVAHWVGANSNTIRNYSAVGYIFGKQMQAELGCPVGLISAPIGGSSLEFWLSAENYVKVEELYQSYGIEYYYDEENVVTHPSLGYNGLLYPLTGLNVRGVVWYQGESNAFGTVDYYDDALRIFMEQCREMFNNNAQLAFTICELARYEAYPHAYSVVNEGINNVASTDPYVAVARNLDQGDWFDIHPVDKYTVGQRAAYETLRVFFKVDKPAPITVTSHTFNADGSVSIELSCAASLVNGTNGFEVCVNGEYTYDCNVSINGNTLTVTTSGEITAVRYGYTCEMTDEIKNDVSKMVTVYDENGFPLDLFLISK